TSSTLLSRTTRARATSVCKITARPAGSRTSNCGRCLEPIIRRGRTGSPLRFRWISEGGQPHARNVLQGLAEDPLKGGVITVLLKNGQPAVGAIENMIDVATQGQPLRSSHREKL